MKFKEAIEDLRSDTTGDGGYQKLCRLFAVEVDARVKLRAHGKKPTDGVVISVVDEVCDWARRVGRGIGMGEEKLKSAVDSERGAAFAKYRVIDPVAADQMKKMRRAYLGGQAPIEVLTPEGLDAISSMMLGRVMQECREYFETGKDKNDIGQVQMAKLANEMRLSDKPFCQYGVKARSCPHQETLYQPTKSRPMPTSVEQLQFYCQIDPKECNWEELVGGG